MLHISDLCTALSTCAGRLSAAHSGQRWQLSVSSGSSSTWGKHENKEPAVTAGLRIRLIYEANTILPSSQELFMAQFYIILRGLVIAKLP